MKLLLVARRYPPDVLSGTETVFACLYAQARRHHEVRLVVGFRGARERVPSEAVAVDLRGVPAGVAHARMYAAAREEVRRFQPDAILSNSVELVFGEAPTVVIVHDLNFGQAGRGIGALIREQFYRLQCRRAAAVVAVSRATQEALAQHGISKRVHVVHNGVDLERFAATPPPATPPLRFLVPGRILSGKGQHVALDAFGRMRPDQRAGLELEIAGAIADPMYADQLRLQAFKLPVRFAFDVPDLVPHYQAAHVVLFPTRMVEGFGFAAVEGMAAGRPVIWSEQPAIREATGGVGVPVPGDDPVALREQMLRLAADPALRERLGREGRAYVETLTWANAWRSYEAVLDAARQRRSE